MFNDMHIPQWKSAPKTELMDSKLKCSFIEDQDSTQADKPAPSAFLESAVAASVSQTYVQLYIHVHVVQTRQVYRPSK